MAKYLCSRDDGVCCRVLSPDTIDLTCPYLKRMGDDEPLLPSTPAGTIGDVKVMQLGSGKLYFDGPAGGRQEFPVMGVTIEREKPKYDIWSTDELLDVTRRGTFSLDPMPAWMSAFGPADLGTRYHKDIEDQLFAKEVDGVWSIFTDPERRYYVMDEVIVEAKPRSDFDLSAFNLPPKANLPIGKNTPEWAKDKHAREERNRKKNYLDFESYSRAALPRPRYEEVLTIRPRRGDLDDTLGEVRGREMEYMRQRRHQLADQLFMSLLFGAFLAPPSSYIDPVKYSGPSGDAGKWYSGLMPMRDNVVPFKIRPLT